jgi:hypothetical protein
VGKQATSEQAESKDIILGSEMHADVGKSEGHIVA